MKLPTFVIGQNYRFIDLLIPLPLNHVFLVFYRIRFGCNAESIKSEYEFIIHICSIKCGFLFACMCLSLLVFEYHILINRFTNNVTIARLIQLFQAENTSILLINMSKLSLLLSSYFHKFLDSSIDLM